MIIKEVVSNKIFKYFSNEIEIVPEETYVKELEEEDDVSSTTITNNSYKKCALLKRGWKLLNPTKCQ